MSEYAFRKIDIDALDEDTLLRSDLVDPDPRGPDGVLADAKRKSGEVRSAVAQYVHQALRKVIGCFLAHELTGRNDIAGALAIILSDPPYGSDVDEARVRLLYCPYFRLLEPLVWRGGNTDYGRVSPLRPCNLSSTLPAQTTSQPPSRTSHQSSKTT